MRVFSPSSIFALAAALMAATAALPVAAGTSSAPRTIHFEGGIAVVTTSVVSGQTVDHVVIKDPSGNVESESDCDAASGTYDRIVAFGKALAAAAQKNDPHALAALMQYPLRVNVNGSHPGKTIPASNSGELIDHYQAIFTAAVIEKLAGIEPHDVFCKDGMSMLGDGEIWMKATSDGTVKGAIINQ